MSQIDQRFILGIELFNRQEFYDCHALLEELWKEQLEPERQLTQGIIQIAVAYYHALRSNYNGSIKLIRKGLPRIKQFVGEQELLELEEFISAVEQDLTTLQSSKPSELLIPLLRRKS